MKKNILLCVAGKTPQIITETLFDLIVQNKTRIDEIRIITTLEGRDVILQNLLDAETGKFYEFCSDFEIDSDSIKFDETCISLLRTPDGQMLEDIRTPMENEFAGNQICEIVRELCQNEDSVIYASAAGGRKTMGIYLTLAMSLFGRSEDSLSHVLVNADFETNRQFYYPPPNPIMIDSYNPVTKETKKISTETAKIYLAKIPFIRLRGISNENEEFGKARNYIEMVDEAQKVLDIEEQEYDLNIDIAELTLEVGEQKVKLTPREFFFYLIFVKKRLEGNRSASLRDLTEQDFHSAFKEIIALSKKENVGWEEVSSFSEYNFAETMLAQLLEKGKSDKQKREDFSDFRGAFSKVITLIKSKLENIGIDSRYYLVSTDDGTASYRLKISSQHIKFTDGND